MSSEAAFVPVSHEVIIHDSQSGDAEFEALGVNWEREHS